jgi:hypothetical protein
MKLRFMSEEAQIKQREVNETKSRGEWENNLQSAIGLRKIVDLLSNSRKIVGHNMLLDVLYISNAFFGELSESYAEWKRNQM